MFNYSPENNLASDCTSDPAVVMEILSRLTEGVTVLDCQGRFLYANQAAAKLCGFESAHALIASSAAEVLSRFKLLDEWKKPLPLSLLIDQEIHAGSDHSLELVVCYRLLPGNECRWVRIQSRAMRDEAGAVKMITLVFEDITARKHVETMSQFLIDASRILASSLDYESTLRVVAEMSVPELADWSTIDLLEEDHSVRRVALVHRSPRLKKYAQRMRRRYPVDLKSPFGIGKALKTGEPELFSEVPDLLKLAPSGSKHSKYLRALARIQLRSSMIVPLIVRGKIIGALMMATSESLHRYSSEDLLFARELAGHLALAVDNARHFLKSQEAIRARDEFLSMAAHELKTPLTSLKLQIQLFAESLGDGRLELISKSKFSQLIRMASGDVDRLSCLITDLYNVAGIHRGEVRLRLEEVEMSSLIQSVIERHRGDPLTRGTPIEFSYPGMVMGYWDRIRLEQVVSNLLGNAVKYGLKKPVKIVLRQTGDRVLVEFQDRGPGIPPQNLSRIFNRFERAVGSGSIAGLGLGLYIVHEILSLHGGSIRVESNSGSGSCFIVDLPIRSSQSVGLQKSA